MSDVRGLDPRFSPSIRLSSVRFSVYTREEVLAVSCKRISNPNTFDSLLHPNLGGLYDPALGPCGKQDQCGTCGLNYVHCPGHMGHISLQLPVYHPVFFSHLCSLLKISCWNCHRLFCTPIAARVLIGQLELIELGLLSDASGLEANVGTSVLSNTEGADNHAPGKSKDGILKAIDSYVEERKNSAGSRPKSRSKNVLESRSSFIMEFIKTCGRGVKKCHYCSAPPRSLREENRSKLSLKGLTTLKKAVAWRDARVKEERRKVGARQATNGDDDIGAVPEGEEDCPPAEAFTKQSYLTPLEVKKHVECLWENQRALINAVVGCTVLAQSGGGGGGGGVASTCRAREISPADIFFLDVVAVPPSRFRPVRYLK